MYGQGVGYSPELSQWVAIGQSSNATFSIQVSADGINWTGVVTTSFSFGSAVSWSAAQSQWVAAMAGGIQTSPDGMHWTPTLTAGAWSGVANQSVVQSQWNTALSPSTIATSNIDAVTLEASAVSATSVSATSVNAGRIVAQTLSTSSVSTGTINGVSFAKILTGPTTVVSTLTAELVVAHNVIAADFTATQDLRVQTGGVSWVAVGHANNGLRTRSTIQWSVDGLTWQPIVAGGFHNFGVGVAFNGQQWVAVGEPFSFSTPTSIQTSLDGKSWSPAITGGFDVQGYNVAYGNGFWVAVGETSGDSTSTIQRSADGFHWSSVSPNGFQAGQGIAYNSNTSLWVATGIASGSPLDALQWSSDGVNWNSAQSGGFAGQAAYGIATSGSLWVATGTDFTTSINTIQWSTDGSNWSPALSGGFDYIPTFINDAFNVAYSAYQNLWVAVGTSVNDPRSTIQWSSDGMNWNPAESGGFDLSGVFGGGVAYNAAQNLWVATGYTAAGGVSALLNSSDGSNWAFATAGGFQGIFNSSGFGVAANSNAVTYITSSSIITQELMVSSINGVPATQGYTDTTTFQYNYVDPVLGFQAGVVLSTINAITTIGYVVNRPLAPINYFNIAYSSITASDTYFLQLSTVSNPPALYGPYSFSTVNSGVPEVYEQFIPSISTAATQALVMRLSTATGLTLYSLTLGYN